MSKRVEDWEIINRSKELELRVAQFQLERVGLYNNTQNSYPLAVENKLHAEKPNKEDIPEKIKELMTSSPNHPEVEEIDSSDRILGARFEAENYPPGFAQDDGDDN